MRLRAAQLGEREAVADLDALHRLDPHQRGGEPRVEPLVLASRTSRARAGRRARAPRRRRRPCRGRPAPRRSRLLERLRSTDTRRRPRSRSRQQRLRDRAGGDATAVWRALARSSASRTSSRPYLSDTGEVGVARSRQRDGLRALALRLALGRPRAHPPRPVLVVAVADDERERRAERPPVAEAGEHLDLVRSRSAGAGCGRSPAGAARDPRRSPPGRGRAPPGGRSTIATSAGPCDSPAVVELKRHRAKPRAARMTSSGAATPVQSSNEAAPWRRAPRARRRRRGSPRPAPPRPAPSASVRV